jgi:gliding motility-associated-like protein
MKKYIFYIILSHVSFQGFTQNLLTNPSFEDFVHVCFGPITYYVFSHDTIVNTNQTPKYWNEPDVSYSGAAFSVTLLNKDCGAIPSIENGYPEPYDGKSVAIISIRSSPFKTGDCIEFRSYIQTKFTPLKKNHTYYVSFYVSAPKKNQSDTTHLYVTDNIGAYLTENRVLRSCFDSNRNFIKANPQIINPAGRYLEDTGKWQKVCGYFTAKGGERWLTIGNFADSNSTNLKDLLHNTQYDSFPNAALLIDMVSLEEFTQPVVLPSNKIAYLCDTINGTATLNATTGYLKYLWNTGDTTATIAVHKIGKYWVQVTDECGTLTDTVNVIYMLPKQLIVSNDTVKCNDGKPIQLFTNTGFQKYKWSTGDTTSSIAVMQTGNYWVNVSYECGTLSDTVHVVINSVPIAPTVSNKQYCIGDTAVVLNANGFNLVWYAQQNDNIGTQQAPMPATNNIGTQNYYVTQNINNCESVKAEIKVNVIDKPFILLGNDTTICQDDLMLLGENKNNTYLYIWQDNDTTVPKIITKKGMYILTAMNECGEYRDSILINTKQCTKCIQFPTAFSPNNDGINDMFYPRINCEINDYHLQIFNRWGNKIFETYNISDKWSGEDAPQDTYIIVCNYSELNKSQIIKGIIVLLK